MGKERGVLVKGRLVDKVPPARRQHIRDVTTIFCMRTLPPEPAKPLLLAGVTPYFFKNQNERTHHSRKVIPALCNFELNFYTTEETYESDGVLRLLLPTRAFPERLDGKKGR